MHTAQTWLTSRRVGCLRTQSALHPASLSLCFIALQEMLLNKCMAELAGQAGTACCERGYMLHVLWQALRRLLAAVLHDRDASR